LNYAHRIIETTFDGATHRYRLALEGKPVEDAVKHKLSELQRTSHIKGFRPGKVPYKIIRGIYYERVTQSIVEQLAIGVSRKTIQEKDLKPVSKPVIESITKTDSGEFEFVLALEIFPEVVLKSFEGLVVRHLLATPDQARLDAVRNTLLSDPQSHHDVLDPNDQADILALVTEQLRSVSRLHLKRQVLDWLADQYVFEVPESMRTRELKRIIGNHKHLFGDEPDIELREQYSRIARRRILLAIILFKIGSSQDIHIPKGEIEALVRAQAKRDPEHENEILKFYFENPTALAELQSPLFEDYVIDYILNNSEVITVEVSTNQLVDEAGLDIDMLA